MRNVTGFIAKPNGLGYEIVYKGSVINIKPFTEGQYIITTALTYEITQSFEAFMGFTEYMDALRDFVDEYDLDDLDSDFEDLGKPQEVFNINVYLTHDDIDRIRWDFVNKGKAPRGAGEDNIEETLMSKMEVPAPNEKKYYFIKMLWTKQNEDSTATTETIEVMKIIEVDKRANMIQAYNDEADKLLGKHIPSSVKLVDIRRL